MELKIAKFGKICIIASLLCMFSVEVRAEYYNNALGPAYRATQIKMENATAAQKAGAVVTSIKNQGQTGTCWAFAAVASAESSLLTQLQKATRPLPSPEIDLSEKYGAWMVYALSKDEEAKKITHPYFLPTGAFSEGDLKVAPTEPKSRAAFKVLTQGGTISQEMSLLTNGYLVSETGKPELKFYNQAADALNNKVDAVVTPSYKARDLYFRTDASFNTKGTSNIGISSVSQLPTLQKYKDLIKQNGSMGIGYCTNGAVTNHNTGSIYKDVKEDPTHAVLVVGYDDNYEFTTSKTDPKSDINMLSSLPPGKGAWIIKNSWGTGEPGDPTGDAGYYYISYYDKSLQFSYASVIEPDTGRYTVTDTHTPLITLSTLNLKSNPVFASQYKAKDNQFVKAVSFLTNTEGASYKIEVINKSNNNANAKPIYTQTGKFEGTNAMAGYHTVDLSKFILVPKNESYIVRVTVIAKSGLVECINLASTDSSQAGVTYKSNESYFLQAGQWFDTKVVYDGAVFLNGQLKETSSANGGDFTVASLSDNKNSSVVINLGSQNELYNTDLINPDRKTLSNMTVDIADANRVDNFYGQIIGEGQVTKTGTGALSFFGNNKYTGFTNVNQGILNNYGSSESNVSILSSAIYKVINEKANTSLSERGGIINKGTVYIIAGDKSTINFTNKSDDPADPDLFIDDTGAKWYLNTRDVNNPKAATNGKIAINVDTTKVTEKVFIKGGTISTTLSALFANAIKDFSPRAKINIQGATPSTPARMFASKSGSSSYLSSVDFGKMLIEDKTQIDIDTKMSESSLLSDLIKGSSVDNSGADDNTPNKIKLGFLLDEDVTFTDKTNGIFSSVAQGQIQKVINPNSFAIDRNLATGSYNIAYDTSNGVLTIKNADAPTTLQDALTSTVTSKYYSLDDNQTLSAAWTPALAGNDLTLAGNGKTIDGNNSTQIFNISEDKMLSLKDTNVTQGTGSAIHNEGALSIDATDSNSEFTQNNGTDGGAIYNKDSVVLTATGKDIKLQNNSADNGAGIYNDIDLTVPNKFSEVIAFAQNGNISFEGNKANASGGAIYNKGDLALFSENAQVNLNGNQATSGAGIYNDTGNVGLFTQNEQINFSSNAATANGGAIANENGYVDIITNDANINFSNNTANKGGAIYNNTSGSADATINAIAGDEASSENGGNIVFAGNSAAQGGAIYNSKAPAATGNAVVNLTAAGGNITFDGNSATDKGGAIYNTETVNINAFDNYNVSFKQSTDTIYNTGNVNLNYNNSNYTNGSIITGAQFGGNGTYNLYGGTLALVASTDKNNAGNPNSYGSISEQSNLVVVNDAELNMANGRIDSFKPATLKIENNSALMVAIDCVVNNNTPHADFLDAGTYIKDTGSTSQIVIEAVNLVSTGNNTATSYRVQIADDTLKSEIAEYIMSETLGYRSGYISRTGELILLSTLLPALMDYVDMTDSQRTYTMAADESVILPVGTMQGTNSTLIVNGNNHSINAEYSYLDGVTVSATNTLNLNNVTFNGFETAVTNNGTLNLNNVTFNGVTDPTIYDVKNLSTANLNNTIAGKIYNAGTLSVGATNNLEGVSLKSIDASTLDLRNSTNDVNFKELGIAGNVNLLLNGTKKLDAQTVSHENAGDSLVIKELTQLSSQNTTLTQTTDLQPLITLADDVAFSLGANAKPAGDFNSYKLSYASGVVSVNGADISDNSTKSGSYNVGKSANFLASLTNSVADNKTVTLTASKPNVEITLPNDTTIAGTLGLNNLTTSGSQIIVNNAGSTASLLVSGSTVQNNINLSGGSADVKNSYLNGGINLGSTGELTFSDGTNIVNGAITGLDGSNININSPTEFNNTVDPTTENVNQLAIHNADASQVDFSLNNGGQLYFSKDSYLSNHSNSIDFEGGSLNLINGTAGTINLSSMSFAPATNGVVVSNMYVDVDLANQTMDKLAATTTNVGQGSFLNVAGMHLLSDAKNDFTSINFTQDPNLKGNVITNVSNVVYSPIFNYAVNYNTNSGNFDFARSFNPSILATPVAAQLGSYLTQQNSYYQGLSPMDNYMSLSKQARLAMKMQNKYAASEGHLPFNLTADAYDSKALWYRPFASFESVPLNNGPSVSNISYGSYFGGDSSIIELKHGWDAMYSIYAGYNGSHQNYNNVGIYQNGGTFGLSGSLYKGNFFTGLTANVGANVGEAWTMYGKDTFTSLATGIASKTGYNIELNEGKLILQPSFLMSYSLINTFNYTTAGGADITSDPLSAIQIEPGIKLIGNLKNGWQPYAGVSMVWNIMDKSKFQANDVTLPEMSIAPFVRYGVGLQKTQGERFTGFLQAFMTGGGRNGVGLQFGFRWALGKAPSL